MTIFGEKRESVFTNNRIFSLSMSDICLEFNALPFSKTDNQEIINWVNKKFRPNAKTSDLTQLLKTHRLIRKSSQKKHSSVIITFRFMERNTKYVFSKVFEFKMISDPNQFEGLGESQPLLYKTSCGTTT